MAVHQLLSTLIQDCWRFLYDLDRRLLIFFSATDLDSDLVAFLICEYELTTGLAVLCVKRPFFFESGVRLDQALAYLLLRVDLGRRSWRWWRSATSYLYVDFVRLVWIE